MSPTTLLVVVVILLVVAAWYSTNSKRNKILCFYRGRDKTLENRWVNVTDSFATFRNKIFYVDTRRIVNFWYKGGIHFIFPTKVSCLEYNWNSPFPHDPDDYKINWETPEARKLINLEDSIKAYGKSFIPTTNKKQNALMQYLPIIAIVLVVILGFWMYSNNNSTSGILNQMNDKINTIVK